MIAGSLHDVEDRTASLVPRFFCDLEKWFTVQIQAAAPTGMERKLARQRAQALVASAQGALLLDKSASLLRPARSAAGSLASRTAWIPGTFLYPRCL